MIRKIFLFVIIFLIVAFATLIVFGYFLSPFFISKVLDSYLKTQDIELEHALIGYPKKNSCNIKSLTLIKKTNNNHWRLTFSNANITYQLNKDNIINFKDVIANQVILKIDSEGKDNASIDEIVKQSISPILNLPVKSLDIQDFDVSLNSPKLIFNNKSKLQLILPEAIISDQNGKLYHNWSLHGSYKITGNIQKTITGTDNIEFAANGSIKNHSNNIQVSIDKSEFKLQENSHPKLKIPQAVITNKYPTNILINNLSDAVLEPTNLLVQLPALVVDKLKAKTTSVDLKLDRLDLVNIHKISGNLQANGLELDWDAYSIPATKLRIDFMLNGKYLSSKWQFLEDLKYGANFKELQFNLNIDSQQKYIIENLSAKLFAGSMNAEPINISSSQLVKPFNIKLSNLQLKEIFMWREINGLSGSGSIDGNLPIKFNKDGLTVVGGKIKARSPGGNIKYKPAIKPKLEVPGLEIAYDALENFQYTKLTADINYQANGWMDLALSLAGTGTVQGNKRPIEFSLNLSENIKDLLKSTMIIK